jgi:hypothetical protein
LPTLADIACLRLSNQGISRAISGNLVDIVAWMGAVQAQDYLAALWAVGLRFPGAVEADVEQALAEGGLVRTWPLRGTLHFVAAQDVRWMLSLLAPHMLRRHAPRLKELGLDEATVSRSRELLVGALQGGRRLRREDAFQVLESAGIETAGQRGVWILWRLAQDGAVCYGAREGKQHTLILLEEWAPPTPTMNREQALAELARRYFTSHGPAALADFVWWSGLPAAEARDGLELAKPQLEKIDYEGQAYWYSSSAPGAVSESGSAYLLPAFDEYLVGYKDRSAVLDPQYVRQTNAGGGMLSPIIVIDGQVLGVWKRTLKKKAVVVEASWFTEPDQAQLEALSRAVDQYGAFLNLPALLA